MKLERSDIEYPLWRKKVDSSLFHYSGTTIPTWACNMWGISHDFENCISKRDKKSRIDVEFKEQRYDGWVTVAKQGRKTPAYRLWYSDELSNRLKDVFLMSFVRDIEDRLRKSEGGRESNVEQEIPFWEFLDIEYDRNERIFYFEAYYTQKPEFPSLFKRFIESPVLHKIDDELNQKPPFRIYKTKWRKRDELDFVLGANNVLYTLIDTKKKLLYVGEAGNLLKRLRQDHQSIPDWDYFRYNVLPDEVSHHRKTFERMIIRDYAYLLAMDDSANSMKISEYKLANERVDN